MRELKAPCVTFIGAEGKARLIRSLSDGTAECYLPLAAQFRTQDHPAYCGLSTLVMCLNALQIDPRRRWKQDSVWRWFEEGMLACCEPIDSVKRKGVPLDALACLARCQGASVAVERPITPENTVGASCEEFRSAIREACRSSNPLLIVSFSRKALSQTGDGHFSPIAAYDAETDSCLVLDVARFKLPPYWVPVEALYAATVPVDPSTGRPRGWMTLRRSASAPLLISTVEDLLPAPIGEAATPACCGLVAGTGSAVGFTADADAGASPICADASASSDVTVRPEMLCLAVRLVSRVSCILKHLATRLREAEAAAAAADGAAASGATTVVAIAAVVIVEAFVPAYTAFSATGAGTAARCVKRFSGTQIAEARQLVGEIEAWPVFSLVSQALNEAEESALSKTGQTGAGEASGGCGCGSGGDTPADCVDIKTAHSVALLLAALRHGAVRALASEGGVAAPTGGCNACLAAAAAMEIAPAGSATAERILLRFACLPAPEAGSILDLEAASLAVQLYALSSVRFE